MADGPFLDDDPNAWADPERWPAQDGANGLRPAPQQRQAARPRRQPTPRGPMMFNDHGDRQAFDAYNYANLMHNMQGNYLGGMANQINSVFANEMANRRSIAREQERMAQERWMAGQRAQLERERLANERYKLQTDAANEIRALKFRASQDNRLRGGAVSRTLRTDPMTGELRWMEDWEM